MVSLPPNALMINTSVVDNDICTSLTVTLSASTIIMSFPSVASIINSGVLGVYMESPTFSIV